MESCFKSLFQRLLQHQSSKYCNVSAHFLILDRFYRKDSIYGQHLFLLDVNTKLFKELHVPKVTNTDMAFKLVGSCNGFLCIVHYSLDPTSTLFLWNPTTKQTKKIIEPQHSHTTFLPYQLPPNCLVGFYYFNDDFQLVRLHSFVDGKTHVIGVENYSLSSGLWRDIKCSHDQVLKGNLFWTENNVTVEETLYWVAMEVSEQLSHEMIISFNYRNNLGRKIEMPFSGKKDNCVEVYKKLSVYKDSVSLIICSETKSSAEQCVDLLVFHDKYDGIECWTKLLTIGLFPRLDRPVGIWKNEILMATNSVIHSVGGIIALLPEDDIGADNFSYNVFNYEESFVPLHTLEEADAIEREGFLLL